MTTVTAPKHENLLGICHALGQAFGINPLFLRVALLIGLVLNAEVSLVAYAVAGVAVATAKLLTRGDRKRAAALTPA